jgi:hypothetical protein
MHPTSKMMTHMEGRLRAIRDLCGLRSIHCRDVKNASGHSSPVSSVREREILRTLRSRGPCPYDSIPPTPVGRTNTPHGIAGWPHTEGCSGEDFFIDNETGKTFPGRTPWAISSSCRWHLKTDPQRTCSHNVANHGTVTRSSSLQRNNQRGGKGTPKVCKATRKTNAANRKSIAGSVFHVRRRVRSSKSLRARARVRVR